ncbi:hypothetical protein GF369_03520 [Candidatus Peregrinibacteria bacterium]|nr:hypothetical protein [Candidatus Peregrinibacteria bacterium]
MKTPCYKPSLTERLAALLFPERCVSCRTEGMLLCPRCFRSIRPNIHPVHSNPRGICSITKLYTPCHYHHNPALRKALHHFKYRYYKKVGYYLAPLLYRTLLNDLPPPGTHIVPIPLHKKRKAFRGFNQSHVLATHLSSYIHFPVTPLLKRVKKTTSQATLSRKERRSNLIDAFTLCLDNPPPRTTPLLLIDDVCTTLSTFKSAAETLQNHGYTIILCTALAQA